ncbi:DDE-type integrase/transposase/recombinase [Streptomyces sp. NPDC057582]|uniref:DDE-type integrase/transposase/recombinase n=1 Tax=Streptomyces sp. NPDC057582 TaxID=3346174 RepID=UPI0036AEC939
MLERGVVVSREAIRRWCLSSGRLTPTRCVVGVSLPGGKWHLGEAFVKVNGERKYLWRAVDADGNVLDILVQNRRGRNGEARREGSRVRTTCQFR